VGRRGRHTYAVFMMLRLETQFHSVCTKHISKLVTHSLSRLLESKALSVED
jgi:hypothetical protein